MTKVFIYPIFNTPDQGDGGVRRVIEGQIATLPAEGIELVDKPEDADVIACHIQVPDEYLRRFPDKAFVAHIHGLYWDEYRAADSGETRWDRWCLQANVDVMKLTLMADIVTAPTEWVAQSIRRHTCRDVRVVPHGLELEKWSLTEPDARKYVLWNKSRPDPVCDPEPVYKLAERMPSTSFVTTYGGWSRSAPPPNVTVTGRLPYEQAKKQVEDAAVYLATTRETFGIGTLEAMACGIPVVGWKWGGQREFIEHGVDGWLAQPYDYDGLVEGIKWAQNNRDLIAPAARAKALQFPWPRAAKMYADIYREAAAKKVHNARPKVSVIVTAYKLDKYLDMTLASVLKQDDSFTDWECIVVDDHSPDRCGEIAEAWARKDGRFRVIHNETNLYLAGARNAGIEAARGDYILPLDADDMLGENALMMLTDALDRDRTIHVAYGGVFFVDEDGITPTDYGYGTPGISGWPIDFQFERQIAEPQQGRRPNNLLPYSSMIRRDALILTGGYRERRRTAEDADLWCRLSSYGFTPRKVTALPCLIYRNREDSMSRTIEPDDWTTWYPWSRVPKLTPGGAMRGAKETNALDVDSCDPPIISVIIPVGPGHELLLKDAVDSVDSQTFRQFECIVVNDTGGPLPHLPTWVRIIEPKEGSAPVAASEPAEARAPASTSEPSEASTPFSTSEPDVNSAPSSASETLSARAPSQRIGPAAARNVGIRAAKAKLYLPLDADDILRPHALRVMFEEWMKDGAVIYSDFLEDPREEGTYTVYQAPEFDSRILVENGMLGAVTQLTPVEYWERVGGYDEDLPAWEDWAFQIKLCAAGCCMRRVPTPLWTYRKHTGSRRDTQYVQRNDPGGAKESIIRRFPGLWPQAEQNMGIYTPEQEAVKMACNTCGGGGGGSGGYVPVDSMAGIPKRLDPTAGGAMLVQYIGDKQGALEYRANTEAIYRFASGEPPMYVHPADIEFFAQRSDFKILEGSQVTSQVTEPMFAPPQMPAREPGVPLEGPVIEEPTTEAAMEENREELTKRKRRVAASAGALPEGVTVE